LLRVPPLPYALTTTQNHAPENRPISPISGQELV
jgi:hypothetical protein